LERWIGHQLSGIGARQQAGGQRLIFS